VPPAAPEPDEVTVPPYYVATEDLFVWHPEAGTMPVAAFRKGDQVEPSLVEPNGWGGKVEVPEQFAGQLSAPASPDTESTPASEAEGGGSE